MRRLLLLLVLIGCGGSGSDPTGAAGTGAPMCRETGAGCGATADCCNPLACIQSHCAAAPICGDGVCGAGEANTCCQDCGCAMGTLCSGGTCAQSTVSTMTWAFSNQCGQDIALKFFDASDQLVWPSTTGSYSLPAGSQGQKAIQCTTGSQVCFGASTAGDALFWGVDIDGSKTCTNCCATCGNSPPGNIPLLCN